MAAMVAVLDFRAERNKLLIYKSPRYFLLSFKSTGLSVQEKKRKIDFQDGSHGCYLGFPIETILAFFIFKLPRYFLPSFESAGF